MDSTHDKKSDQTQPQESEKLKKTPESPESPGRRAFFGKVGALTAAALASASGFAGSPGIAEASEPEFNSVAATATGRKRIEQAFKIRKRAAVKMRDLPLPEAKTNGDEERFPNKIGNYSKALPHNSLGEVDLSAYNSMIRALSTATTADFEAIQLGGRLKLENPQCGLAFELQGLDSHQIILPPPPVFDSAEQAGEMVELYWHALTRDIPFTQFDSNPLTIAAAEDISNLTDFRGPKNQGRVTPQTLFRGTKPGELIGPYISQFLLKGFQYGAFTFTQKIRANMPGIDHLTGYEDWLSVQNGTVTEKQVYDSTPRFIRSGRDIAEYVHNDPLYQSVYDAAIILVGMGAARDAGHPYLNLTTTQPFGTFGGPFIFGMLASVMVPALKAVWYNKWYLHRKLRPEEFGGRVHNLMTGAANYPIHSDLLNSRALDNIFSNYGTYLLPQAFPEGCPTHPAYASGHASFVAAGITMLKAFFDESFVIKDPVIPNEDGTALLPYEGPELTVGGELNKLASNIAIGRNIAGVHWRTDANASLGEAVAVGILSELKDGGCFVEDFKGFSLTKFDGTRITI